MAQEAEEELVDAGRRYHRLDQQNSGGVQHNSIRQEELEKLVCHSAVSDLQQQMSLITLNYSSTSLTLL